MAKSKCKCKETECEECPEWIFTFADLVMLMMGFFVILWVLKPSASTNPAEGPVDEKWLETVGKIREAFGHLPDPTSNDPVDQKMILLKLQQMSPMRGKGEKGTTTLEKKGAQGTDPEVTTVRKGKQSIVGGRVLFTPGQSALTGESERLLGEIALQIKGHRTIFRVKGHAANDDFPESADPRLPMDLSLRRAQVVSDYLVAHGVSPKTLRVEGCSTYEPIVERVYSATLREPNRRVEVESSTILVSEFEDPAAPAKPIETQPAHEPGK